MLVYLQNKNTAKFVLILSSLDLISYIYLLQTECKRLNKSLILGVNSASRSHMRRHKRAKMVGLALKTLKRGKETEGKEVVFVSLCVHYVCDAAGNETAAWKQLLPC